MSEGTITFNTLSDAELTCAPRIQYEVLAAASSALSVSCHLTITIINARKAQKNL